MTMIVRGLYFWSIIWKWIYIKQWKIVSCNFLVLPYLQLWYLAMLVETEHMTHLPNSSASLHA